MEEDLKILEEFILYYEAEAISRKFRGTLSISVDEDDIQAIENLIKGYRDGEDIIKKVVKENMEYKKYIEELEVNSIPTSLVKEKIEELLKKLDEPNNDRWEKDDDIYYNKIKAQIRILKDLLEKE